MASHAFWTGCALVADRPSIVTILSVGLTPLTGNEQDRMTAPLRCTEHAPHWATPQPYLVPVNPTCSRMTHSKGVLSSTLTSYALPLMLSFAMEASFESGGMTLPVVERLFCGGAESTKAYSNSRQQSMTPRQTAFGAELFREVRTRQLWGMSVRGRRGRDHAAALRPSDRGRPSHYSSSHDLRWRRRHDLHRHGLATELTEEWTPHSTATGEGATSEDTNVQ